MARFSTNQYDFGSVECFISGQYITGLRGFTVTVEQEKEQIFDILDILQFFAWYVFRVVPPNNSYFGDFIKTSCKTSTVDIKYCDTTTITYVVPS